jgi:UDP-N-acetyl-D-mannosaminuronic acid transferase (WecB/TagA/CpsF family)
MGKLGLEWLYRLTQEPKRLWRRYLVLNPRFVWQAFLQLSGLKKFDRQ